MLMLLLWRKRAGSNRAGLLISIWRDGTFSRLHTLASADPLRPAGGGGCRARGWTEAARGRRVWERHKAQTKARGWWEGLI